MAHTVVGHLAMQSRVLAPRSIKLVQLSCSLSTTNVQSTWILKSRNPYSFRDPNYPKRRTTGHFHQVYDLVENTHDRQHAPRKIDVMLTGDVPELGRIGDIVSVAAFQFRQFLCPEGNAVYATPAARVKFEERKRAAALDPSLMSSSPTARLTQSLLNDMVCNIFLNLHTPWLLDKWHIRAALRQNGVWVPEEAIEMPSQKVEGPLRDQHGKYFNVRVTINNKEQACVLCRIVLFCRDPSENLPELDLLEDKPATPEPLFPGAIYPENRRSETRRQNRSLLSDEPPPSNFQYVPLAVRPASDV